MDEYRVQFYFWPCPGRGINPEGEDHVSRILKIPVDGREGEAVCLQCGTRGWVTLASQATKS